VNLDFPHPRRRLHRAWRLVEYGLPSLGRYRRYGLTLIIPVGCIWLLTLIYLVAAPAKYTSNMTLILPGSGVGGSMNVDSIGQASSVTASAFSSATLSPTENYKRLLMADITLRHAARLSGEDELKFPAPVVKLTDQTNLIEISLVGRTPVQAQKRADALRQAFLADLDALRADESSAREAATRAQIALLETKARDTQHRLLAFQSASGLVSLEQFNSRVSALDTLRDRERQARTTLSDAAATSRQLARNLGSSPADARQAMLLKADPVFQSLLVRYAALYMLQTEKGATLGTHHAMIEELSAQVGSLQDAVVGRGQALTGLSRASLLAFADQSVSEGRAQLMQALTTGDSQAAGAKAAVAEIQAQIVNQTTATSRSVGDASKLADLTRDLRVADAVLSSAIARLDTNKSDPFASYPLVQTLEAPELPRAKSSPSKLLALAGAMGGTVFLLIGFTLAWLRQPILRRILPKG